MRRSLKKLVGGCALLGVMGLLPAANAALVTTTQDFEGFTAGDIGGQGAWHSKTPSNARDASVNVISITAGAAASDVYQGDKSLRLEDNVTWGTAFADYAGTPTTSGTVSWVAKISSDASAGPMFVEFGSGDTSVETDDGDAINRIGFDASTGKFNFTASNTPATNTPNYVADRWYQFRIDFDTNAGANGKVSLTITDLTTNQPVYTASNQSFKSGFTKGAALKEITVRGVNSGTGTLYLDNFSSTVPEPGSLALLGLGGLLMLSQFHAGCER